MGLRVGKYNYKSLNTTDHINLEDSFMDAYVEEISELENIRTSTKQLRKIKWMFQWLWRTGGRGGRTYIE